MSIPGGKLGPQEIRALRVLEKEYRHGYGHLFLRHIAKKSKLNLSQTKRAVRKLARRGLVKLSPLFREHDGMLAGSGYGCTLAGLEMIKASVPGQAISRRPAEGA